MNAVSFFAGAGGLDLGLTSAGFNIRLAVELEELYCETLRLNNHENVRKGDIMEYTRERIMAEAQLETIDLMVGGSPCQSFSTAGKRRAFDSEGGQAMLKYADLVVETQPRAFLLENVRGLLSAKKDSESENGSALEHLLSRFPGYTVTYKLLNSADYGVPQKRERVFFVGIRNDLNRTFEFPEPTHNEKGTDGKEPWVMLGDIFQGLQGIEHHFVTYSAERLRFMQMIPAGGGNWRDLRAQGEDVVKEAMGGAYESGGGKVGYFRRLHMDRPSPTVLTSPIQKSTNLGHPLEDRPLSLEEYLAIQEFPTDYQVAGNLTSQYVQIGNAVPVRLAEVLGTAILNTLEA